MYSGTNNIRSGNYKEKTLDEQVLFGAESQVEDYPTIKGDY